MPKLKVAIVGSGRVATMLHMPALMALKGKLTVVAACDSNKAMAEKMASKYGIKSTYTSMREMLSKEKPDIVDICTPPQTHRDLAIEAMEAGCHALVEKPLGMDLKECDEIFAASERNKVKLCAMHNQRFRPVFMDAQRIAEGGELGKVHSVSICYMVKESTYLAKAHWASKLPGGMLFDYLPHQVYLSSALIKGSRCIHAARLEGTSDTGVTRSQYKVDLEGDHAWSSIFILHPSSGWRYTIDIACTEGSISVDLLSGILLKDKLGSLSIYRKNLHSLSVAGQFLKRAFATGIRPDSKRWSPSHRILIERFADCVANDTAPPVPAGEVRATMMTVEEALKMLY